MLSPYKVLDLSDERGHLCGQILGDLGADVVLVEPPTGSLSRHAGPFYKDKPHRDRSLSFWALAMPISSREDILLSFSFLTCPGYFPESAGNDEA